MRRIRDVKKKTGRERNSLYNVIFEELSECRGHVSFKTNFVVAQRLFDGMHSVLIFMDFLKDGALRSDDVGEKR